MRFAAIACAAAALCACATTEPGWTGDGAVAFDEALAACQDAVSTIAAEDERRAALEQCMAGKGWTRG